MLPVALTLMGANGLACIVVAAGNIPVVGETHRAMYFYA